MRGTEPAASAHHRWRALAWLIAALASLGTGALLITGAPALLAPADTAGLAIADGIRHPWLDGFFRTVTWLGSLYVLAPAGMVIAGALAYATRSAAAACLVPVALGGAALLAHVGKWLVGRPRPDLHASLIPLPAEPAYPSGHAMQVTAFGLALLLACRPRRAPRRRRTIPWASATALLVLVVLLVLAARLYLQVHFPSDVAFGALAAACWVQALHTALLARR